MQRNDYPSELCNYCPFTDYGLYPLGTGPWNLCEGRFCEEVYEEYIEMNPDEDRSLDEMF